MGFSIGGGDIMPLPGGGGPEPGGGGGTPMPGGGGGPPAPGIGGGAPGGSAIGAPGGGGGPPGGGGRPEGPGGGGPSDPEAFPELEIFDIDGVGGPPYLLPPGPPELFDLPSPPPPPLFTGFATSYLIHIQKTLFYYLSKSISKY